MILNIYKEKGWTSFDVVAKLRGILKTKKIGHAGTLDPLAEGVLVILTEKDTKSQDEFMGEDKEYLADVAFGAQSPTYDLEGQLLFNEVTLSKGELEEALTETLESYIGEYEQQVPAFSATKHKGKRLYKEARKGNLIDDLPKKEVSVSDIKLESIFEDDIEGRSLYVARLKITCGKGFYVRSLANDLGEDLATGAVLIKLTRTRVGKFRIEDSKKLTEITPEESD